MNPLILLGLGAVAFMAMGKKKPKPIEDELEDTGEDEAEKAKPLSFVATKIEPKRKKAVVVQLPPINYSATINSQASLATAKQCHLQGMNGIDQIAGCVANKLFPGWNWDQRSGWQNDAWARMKNIARQELGLPIIPIL
jgi:hypothetical protein